MICCSCFCNEQLNKNVKCGKEYFTLNVSNIVLVIFKSFILFCWEKKRIQKKNRILNRNRNILVKNRNWIIFPNRSALIEAIALFGHSIAWFSHGHAPSTVRPFYRQGSAFSSLCSLNSIRHRYWHKMDISVFIFNKWTKHSNDLF